MEQPEKIENKKSQSNSSENDVEHKNFNVSIEIGQNTFKNSKYVDFVKKRPEIANVSTIPAVKAIFVFLCAARHAVACGGVRWDVRWRAVGCGGRQKSQKQKENDGNIFMLCGLDEFGTIITKNRQNLHM